jgi:hypothetical protein
MKNADIRCLWALCRTDCYELVTDELLTIDEFLAELRQVLEAWDDPSLEMPELVINRSTPEQTAQHLKLRQETDKRIAAIHGPHVIEETNRLIERVYGSKEGD